MGWEIMEGRILATSFLEVSFQRYPKAPEGRIQAAPSSCGALPVALAASQRALVPLDAEEAVWIGLAARRRSVVVLVRAGVETDRGLLDLTTGESWSAKGNGVLVPPARALEGIPALEGGFWPITRVAAVSEAPATSALRIEAVPSVAAIGRMAQPQRPRPQHELERSGERRLDPPAAESDREWLAGQTESMRIVFVDPAHFATTTGLSWQPLDDQARYGGWRLP